MEPATVIGLATNIVQLMQLGNNVIASVKEIRRSVNGLSNETASFCTQANVLRNDLTRLIDAHHKHEDDAFAELVMKMRDQADMCLQQLGTLHVKNNKSWWEPWKVALKAWWIRKDLEARFQTMDRMGKQVTLHIVNDCRRQTKVKMNELSSDVSVLRNELTCYMDNLLGEVKNLQTLENRNALLSALNMFYAEKEERRIHLQCLRALYFPQISRRKDEVVIAHDKTFRWILEDSKDQPLDAPTENHFRIWLQSVDSSRNIFWVSGKPGSGKSTLMKYLAAQDTKLRRYLQEWVEKRGLLILDYFFWKPGSPLQRSLKGLARTLLLEILKEHPHLINEVFRHTDWISYGDRYEFPQSELFQALQRIVKLLDKLGICLLIFIDGLDEFDDRDEQTAKVQDLGELLNFLQYFYRSPSIKLCVSSRHLSSFEMEFRENEAYFIRIEELTRDDIKAYIHNIVEDNQKFKEMAEADPNYDSLLKELIDAANGVFLWVSLAARSLLSGVQEQDRVEDLQKRLRQLPQELEDFYELILSSIPKEYEQYVARSLIYLSSDQSSFWQGLSLHFLLEDRERERMLTWETCTPSLWHKHLSRTKARLVNHCRGLVEVETLEESDKLCKHIFNPVVYFSHRTIIEFLKKAPVRGLLMNKAELSAGTGDFEFEVSLALIHVAICLFSGSIEAETLYRIKESLRLQPSWPYRETSRWRSFTFGLHYNDHPIFLFMAEDLDRMQEFCYEASKRAAPEKWWSNLMRFRAVLTRPWPNSGISVIHLVRAKGQKFITETENDANAAIAFAVQYGLPDLLSKELERCHHPGASLDLSPELSYVYTCRVPLSDVANMLLLLLKHSANPNEIDPATESKWWVEVVVGMWHDYGKLHGYGKLHDVLLSSTCANQKSGYWFVLDGVANDPAPRAETIKVTTSFLEYGADPNAAFPLSFSEHRADLKKTFPSSLLGIGTESDTGFYARFREWEVRTFGRPEKVLDALRIMFKDEEIDFDKFVKQGKENHV